MAADHEIRPQAGTVYGWHGLESDGQSSSDFPLTAACVGCGQFIIRRTPKDAWQHRAPDAEPISGPETGGWWLPVGGKDGTQEAGTHPVLVASDGHSIVPKPGTVTRESDGQPGNLLAVFDYPLKAVCMTCREPVRVERMFLAEWEHVIPAQDHR